MGRGHEKRGEGQTDKESVREMGMGSWPTQARRLRGVILRIQLRLETLQLTWVPKFLLSVLTSPSMKSTGIGPGCQAGQIKGRAVYRGVQGAGERTIHTTKALEQLENTGKGKETLRLKWKKRSSCRGGLRVGVGGHPIEDWISIGETVPGMVPGKGWLKRWRV